MRLRGRLAATLVLLSLCGLAGCGLKGDLYLPDPPVQAEEEDEDEEKRREEPPRE